MRLIDADALCAVFQDIQSEMTKYRGGYQYLDFEEKAEYDCVSGDIQFIQNAPTIELPVHGRWIYEHFGGMWPVGSVRPEYKCSVCGDWTMKHKRPYCPNCGAKMDKKLGDVNV